MVVSNDKNSPKSDSQKSILRSTSVMSLGTLMSRGLGFLRDVVLARFFGTDAIADAFFVAFRIPNLFRDLVGEGAVNSALVPIISEYKEKKDQKQLHEFITAILIIAVSILLFISILGVFAAPLVVRIIAPGFIANPEKLQLTITLTQIMFPYLVLIGLTAYCMGILYTMRRFLAPAFSPCLLNISMIIAALLATQWLPRPVFGLAIGVLIGGVLQLIVQIPSLLRTGLRLVWPKKIWNEGVKRVRDLLVPRIFGAAVYQTTVFVDTFCASLAMIVGVGGISAIYYANRIIQFPLGVFGIALASVLLPSLSGMASRNDKVELKKTITYSLENVFFVLSPCAVLIITLAEPLIRVMFQRGEFDAHSTAITSWALVCYAIGLVSYGGIKILATSFHSLHDTKTPVKAAAFCLIVNAALNFILMYPLKIGGIALASSISATLDFLILFIVMHRRLQGIARDFGRYVIKLLFCCGGMSLVINHMWDNAVHLSEILRLFVVGFFGIIVFFVLGSILQLPQVLHIKKWLGKKQRQF